MGQLGKEDVGEGKRDAAVLVPQRSSIWGIGGAAVPCGKKKKSGGLVRNSDDDPST
jgi:hypothetical protein